MNVMLSMHVAIKNIFTDRDLHTPYENVDNLIHLIILS